MTQNYRWEYHQVDLKKAASINWRKVIKNRSNYTGYLHKLIENKFYTKQIRM